MKPEQAGALSAYLHQISQTSRDAMASDSAGCLAAALAATYELAQAAQNVLSYDFRPDTDESGIYDIRSARGALDVRLLAYSREDAMEQATSLYGIDRRGAAVSRLVAAGPFEAFVNDGFFGEFPTQAALVFALRPVQGRVDTLHVYGLDGELILDLLREEVRRANHRH